MSWERTRGFDALLLGGNESAGDHAPQHVTLAFFGSFEVDVRRICRRRGRHPGQ